MRTITHSEFQAASGEPVYVSTVHYASAAERKAGDAACQRVVAPQAFVPDDGLAGIVGKGREFDPAEPAFQPKDVTIRLSDGTLALATLTAAVRSSPDPAEEPWPSDKDAAWVGPPNCDFVSHGEALAHAQHRAAEGGEGCDSVACSITQGVSD